MPRPSTARSLAAVALLCAHCGAQANELRALVLTDFHFDELYTVGSDTTQDCHRGTGAAGEFGVHSKICDTPKTTMLTSLQDAASAGPYGVAFFLGDGARHDQDSASPITESQMFAELSSVARAVRDTLGQNVTVLPTIGNNDVFPHDTLQPGPNSCLTQIAQAWEPILPEQVRDAFRENGSYAYRVPGTAVLVISLNTLYLADLNDAVHACNHDDSPGAALMTWFKAQVAQAALSQLKVVVIGHVPPTSQWHTSCRTTYASIVGAHLDTFAAHFYGHRHYDSFNILYSDGTVAEPAGTPKKEDKPKAALRGSALASGPLDVAKGDAAPVAAMLIAPSVLPEFNTAFRVAQFAADGSLFDYAQYYYDLDASNRQQRMAPQLEYSARQAFPALAVHGLGVTGWAQLLGDIASNANTEALYSRYSAVSWAGAQFHA